ncbi:hypothetical protein [Deinococcus deserti]|uniref:hypothetical protein n=1 Tax=Deinococcus deserti TaxID=310783 RepID=UPI0013923A0D|nr:hypothetical protein [Deinococcus deserti]
MENRIRPQLVLRRGLCRLATALLLVTAQAAPHTTPTGLLVISKPARPVVASDPPSGRVFRTPPDLSAAQLAFTIDGAPQSLEYVDFNSAGDAFITFDDGPSLVAPGGFLKIRNLAGRAAGRFDAARDQWVSGPRSGLKQPKDIVVSPRAGLVIIADFGDATLKVFAGGARGDIAPRFITPDLGRTSAGPRRPWGLAYDESADRLIVGATDGTLVVFDRYLAGRGLGSYRVIVPTMQGQRAAANLHDLVYLPAQDTVLMVDVGAAIDRDQSNFDSDGAILVLSGIRQLTGEAPVRLRISGPKSLLGNPVGVAFDGSALFVADRARHTLMRFDGLLKLKGRRDLAPSAAVTVVAPESVMLIPPATR